MRLIEYRAARRLVYSAALHADEPVLNDVEKTDAVLAADLVQLQDYLLRAHCFAVESYGNALLKVEGYVGGGVGRHDRGDAHLKEAFLLVLRLVARVLKVKTLVGEMPEVLIL